MKQSFKKKKKRFVALVLEHYNMALKTTTTKNTIIKFQNKTNQQQKKYFKISLDFILWQNPVQAPSRWHSVLVSCPSPPAVG